jgi:hypothetical protein
MPSLSPILTATPGELPTYSVGMAETFSWVPIEGANRPLYAQATYLTNASDISITTGALSLDMTPTNNKIDTTNTRLNTTNTKLDSLTAIQTNKQDQIITLLHSVTGMAIQVDLNTDDLKINVDQVETLLQQLTAQLQSQNGQNGVDVLIPGSTYTGNWSSVTILSATKFQTFEAKTSSTTNLLLCELPVNCTFTAPITSIRLTYGVVLASKK